MGAPLDGALSEAQRSRIEEKIRQIGQDIAYLVKTGGAGPVYGGSFLADADFQRCRAEILQQVIDSNDVAATQARAVRALMQAGAEADPQKAEERRLEAALLLWAVEEV